jgi:ribosome-binding protein aMBF1 (putative translation factor)
MTKHKSATDILRHHTGIDPATDPEFREIAHEYGVARLIYDVRTAAGITQQELAELAGTQQSVISRLEDADYEGHSVSMLERIANAMKMDLEIRMVPQGASPRQAG